MATIKAFIRTGKKNKESNIRFRLSDGRKVQLFHKSEIVALSNLWDENKEQYKAKCVINTEERIKLNTAIAERKKLILSIYSTIPSITSDQLEQLIDEKIHPEKFQKIATDFFSLLALYLEKKDLSDVRERDYRVLIRILHRYEAFAAKFTSKNFKLSLDSITSETIEDLESYIRNEYLLSKEYPSFFEQFSIIKETGHKSQKLQPRGNNTVVLMMKKLRAFFNWCLQQEFTSNRPMARYKIGSEKYGTPFYLTLDERNLIADYDLSAHAQLATQRDIFIFQCLVGCRVSDLLKLKDSNIINEAIEYIPHKTKDERPEIVRVPLNERAKVLVAKYRNIDRKGRLFPFISPQKYNDDIKSILRLCEVTRSVTILNPTTGKEEKRPINEIASSHMARRTFVGNLYKKVKDPNLVGSLSGHKEGSKAFARYREIDDEIKKELVNMIE
nr:site-specific integrase [uncultured Bacteroides sp.]